MYSYTVRVFTIVVSSVSLECMLKKSTAHEWLVLVLGGFVSWVLQHPGSLTVADICEHHHWQGDSYHN
jgi:hypothetical protein